MDNKLIELMCGVLELETITAGDSTGTVASWDSLRHLQLMTALEESYSILLEPEEMMELNSVAAIQALITSRGAS